MLNPEDGRHKHYRVKVQRANIEPHGGGSMKLSLLLRGHSATQACHHLASSKIVQQWNCRMLSMIEAETVAAAGPHRMTTVQHSTPKSDDARPRLPWVYRWTPR